MRTRKLLCNGASLSLWSFLACTGLGAGLIAAGCSGVDSEGVKIISCPSADPATFKPVSHVLELRCGTLDCHGNAARPLRIYGQDGLRRPETAKSLGPACDPGGFATYYSGGGCATTPAELLDNARSVCGLEPELTAQVHSAGADPSTLTFVRKARLQEKHKGGQIWEPGSDGDTCITSWLKGNVNTAACQNEAAHP